MKLGPSSLIQINQLMISGQLFVDQSIIYKSSSAGYVLEARAHTIKNRCSGLSYAPLYMRLFGEEDIALGPERKVHEIRVDSDPEPEFIQVKLEDHFAHEVLTLATSFQLEIFGSAKCITESD